MIGHISVSPGDTAAIRLKSFKFRSIKEAKCWQRYLRHRDYVNQPITVMLGIPRADDF